MKLTEIIQAIEDYMNASLGVNGEITRRAEEAVKELKTYPACEQIRWERDVAIQQLADLGYSLGEKPRTDRDLISRQAAIDAIRFGITYVKKINVETGETESLFEKENRELENAILRVSEIPSWRMVDEKS